MTHELTGEQRDQIFGRSLGVERNKLQALDYAVLALPNDDAFPLEIAAIEKVLREWIT